VRAVPGGAAAAGARLRIQDVARGVSAALLHPGGARLRAFAGRQPGRVPVPARRGVAARAGERVASRAAPVLAAASVRAGAVAVHDLPAPSLLRGPARGLSAGTAGDVAGAASRPLVDGAPAQPRLRDRAWRARRRERYFAGLSSIE